MDVRRSARVATELQVLIQGLESEPVLRRGDISTTGIYFLTNVDVGDVGMMSWLTITSADGARSISVMAYVVRKARLNDIDGSVLTGVAFEFISENDATVSTVNDFVRYVLSLRREGSDPHLSTRLDASAAGSGTTPPLTPERATVRGMTVRSMVIETDWKVSPGDPIVVDILAPGMTNRIRIEGRATRIGETFPAPDQPRYEIQLEIEQQGERPIRSMAPPPPEGPPEPQRVPLALKAMDDAEVSETIDYLLAELVAPAQSSVLRAPRRTHLSGLLSRISMPTLLSLFEMEQLTGKLVVRDRGESTDVYLKQGRLVDVEPLGTSATPRERLASLLASSDGSFEFYVQQVDRPDRIATGTTALLLDLTRGLDEAKRDAS